jgi:quercetin dioxygenase-like cupin family protein
MRVPRFTLYALTAIVACADAGGVQAQGAGLTRTVLNKADVSVPGREAVVVRVEIAPDGRAGRHTHPGDEISYVQEGQFELLVDGQPPRIYKAGESFVVPAGVVHDAHNVGDTPTRLIGVYVVEKGKPLASPATTP